MYYINIRGGKKQWIKMLKLDVFFWKLGYRETAPERYRGQ